MPYEIEVVGATEHAMRMALSDIAGGQEMTTSLGRAVTSMPDQAALVAAVTRLHDLGMIIHTVRRTTRR
ncbi:MAG: hypothetical protein GEV08_04660 [Acidimicrobiia bacterium]|nr:hypothetical protein [Acidimicrobiia bacterium]